MYDVTVSRDNNSSQTKILLTHFKHQSRLITGAQTHKTHFPKNISKKLPMEKISHAQDHKNLDCANKRGDVHTLSTVT